MSELDATPPAEQENPNPAVEPGPDESREEASSPTVHEGSGHSEETSADEGGDASRGSERRDSVGLEAALVEINKCDNIDAKVERTIELMEQSIAQTGAPHFKTFWELRKLALEYFKENVTPALRLQLWGRYTELTKEARRLKEILDEQTAFAVEQIEIAIKALEDELEAFQERLEKAPQVDFGARSATVEEREEFYRSRQRELHLLNAEATRINVLRKELIKTDMRVRQKNKFFQRLSAAGDRVFPRRKDLIREVSDTFISDIEAFVTKYFSTPESEDSLFFLREEIKALQTVAKVLTLNTRSFTLTRTKLSECWEKLKVLEKERKKERVKKKAQYRQHFDALFQKIEEVSKAFGAGTLSINEANKQLDAISGEMRSVELGREEVFELREKLQEAGKPIRDKVRQGEADRKRGEQQKEEARRAKVISLRERIEALFNGDSSQTVEAITIERDAILAELTDKAISRSERVELERQLKPVRDLIADRRAQALMNLSQDDQDTLNQLREIHKERLALRQEIKAQLEHYRKTLGSSGLDFEQAMQYHEQQRLEKERLERADHSLREIEEKITQLEAKI